MDMDWKTKLRENGYLEVGEFHVELTLDNTFLDFDYIPRVAVYDNRTGRWYVLRNPIRKGEKLEECWNNAVKLLERIVMGAEQPVLGDDAVSERFARTLRALNLTSDDQ